MSGEEVVHLALTTSCYYARLGVAKDASEDDIKRAYKRLALKLHPDRNKHTRAEEAFKRVGEAHTILVDPAKRREYDQVGIEGMRNGGGGGGRHFRRGQQVNPEDIFDFFDILRGQQMHQRQRRQGGGGPHHTQNAPFLQNIIQALPLAVIFLAFILSGAGLDRNDTLPFSLDRDADRGFIVEKRTGSGAIPYFVRTSFKREYASSSSLRTVERSVTEAYKGVLHKKCQSEKHNRKVRIERAREYSNSEEMRTKAMAMKTPSCKEYNKRFSSRHR